MCDSGDVKYTRVRAGEAIFVPWGWVVFATYYTPLKGASWASFLQFPMVTETAAKEVPTSVWTAIGAPLVEHYTSKQTQAIFKNQLSVWNELIKLRDN